MTEITSKASRFEMRLTPSQKERLDRAAEFRGLSTSQWALTNLLVAADRDINALRPSGKLPTTRVRRRISRFSRSIMLFVRMRRRCSRG